MKTSFKKNQLIITALAVMIAIAGYLKYSDSMIDSQQLTAASASTDEVIVSDEIEMDISAEDIYASTGITEEVVDEATETSNTEPGEAVFTSTNMAAGTFPKGKRRSCSCRRRGKPVSKKTNTGND